MPFYRPAGRWIGKCTDLVFNCSCWSIPSIRRTTSITNTIPTTRLRIGAAFTDSSVEASLTRS